MKCLIQISKQITTTKKKLCKWTNSYSLLSEIIKNGHSFQNLGRYLSWNSYPIYFQSVLFDSNKILFVINFPENRSSPTFWIWSINSDVNKDTHNSFENPTAHTLSCMSYSSFYEIQCESTEYPLKII